MGLRDSAEQDCLRLTANVVPGPFMSELVASASGSNAPDVLDFVGHRTELL